MGIARPIAEFLARRTKELGISGRGLTIGRQDLDFDLFAALRAAAKAGFLDRDEEMILLPPNHFIFDMVRDGSAFRDYGRAAGAGFVSDRAFFRLLGFETVESLDASDFEGADHIIDLNQPAGAVALSASFDFIHNGGTLEHVFHLPNALANLHDMLKIGGFICHEAPANNCVDHGFFQFSPTLFYDYYRANGYRLHDVYLVQRQADPEASPYFWSAYTPGCLDRVSFGGLGTAIHQVVIIAQRLPDSTSDAIPQQGYYRRTWPTGRS